MRLADLPVRTICNGVSFSSKPHTGGQRIAPPTEELMADIRKLAAFLKLPTPKQLKDTYGLSYHGTLEEARTPRRFPSLSPEKRREMLEQYDLWKTTKAQTLSYQDIRKKHKVTHDTVMKLVAKVNA